MSRFHYDPATDRMEKLPDGRPRCFETVHYYVSNWPHTKQCSRAAKVGDYCKQHDPCTVAKRRAKADAKYEAAWQVRRKEIRGPKMFEALKEIADGHNNPRLLAWETIEDLLTKDER